MKKKNFIWATLPPDVYEKTIKLWKERQKRDINSNREPISFSGFNRTVFVLGLDEYKKGKVSR